MNTLLISYDLGGPETSTSYNKLITKIKSYWTRAKPLESFFFIKADKTCTNIRDELSPFLDSNDKLLVIDISKDDRASYKISEDVITWMKREI